MLPFVWRIIPLGDEMAILQAAPNDCLDLCCSNMQAINHVRPSALKDFGAGDTGTLETP